MDGDIGNAPKRVMYWSLSRARPRFPDGPAAGRVPTSTLFGERVNGRESVLDVGRC